MMNGTVKRRVFRAWRWIAEWDVCGHWHRTKIAAERCAREGLGKGWRGLGVRIESRAR